MRSNASAAVREFRYRHNLRLGRMSTKGIQTMIKGFEETGKLGVSPGRDLKRVTPVFVYGIKCKTYSHIHQSLGQ
ncbi:hypothetical protein TNCT_103951 [Trichonephila clavata]|uniref:DUF4817 domain-containing protein n=1 Tax=Trichonephila clavata TaxID=2740835 RepID=A0A8X6FI14_TRICU|nr:hypothetical protein TNCT_103951 [Trichonephila clavata]